VYVVDKLAVFIKKLNIKIMLKPALDTILCCSSMLRMSTYIVLHCIHITCCVNEVVTMWMLCYSIQQHSNRRLDRTILTIWTQPIQQLTMKSEVLSLIRHHLTKHTKITTFIILHYYNTTSILLQLRSHNKWRECRFYTCNAIYVLILNMKLR
jgi:hypothetical protein